MTDTSKVTRFEVIDSTGRVLVKYNVKVELSLQDDDRTLKVFLTMGEKLIHKPERDGIYPRCVWCGIEMYAPAVMDYSSGWVACYNCNKFVPQDYIKLPQRSHDEAD